VTYPACRL